MADRSLIINGAILAGALAFLGVAQGCGSSDKRFGVSIVTTDQEEWTEEGRAFC